MDLLEPHWAAVWTQAHWNMARSTFWACFTAFVKMTPILPEVDILSSIFDMTSEWSSPLVWNHKIRPSALREQSGSQNLNCKFELSNCSKQKNWLLTRYWNVITHLFQKFRQDPTIIFHVMDQNSFWQSKKLLLFKKHVLILSLEDCWKWSVEITTH